MKTHQALLNEIDNYQDTIFGILAFLNECGWSVGTKTMDPKLRFGLGRRMSTTPSNTISPNNEVTPDLVVQKGASFRLVSEAKHSWSPEADWDDSIKQIKKYDDKLGGWWNGNAGPEVSHDLVLLVHGSQAVRVSDFVKAGVEEGKFHFDRKLAVVGYLRMDQRQQFIQLRREFGKFSDESFDMRLRQIVPIPVDKIVWRDKRFYDSPPPMPALLVMLWDDVFESLAEGYEKLSGKSYTDVPVTVDRLALQLQTFYGFVSDGNRNPGIPRPQWVRETLECFVKFRMAHRDGDAFVIHYRRLRGDKLVRFGRAWNKVRRAKRKGRVRRAPRRRGRRIYVPPGQGKLF